MANSKTVLVIDGGGRGAVLVDKYLQSAHVKRVLAIPGNDLMLETFSKKPSSIYSSRDPVPYGTGDSRRIIKVSSRPFDTFDKLSASELRARTIKNNSLKTVKIFSKVKITDISSIIKICQKEKVDLVDVAQDDAIAAGLVDKLSQSHFKVLGPTKAAGQIEWDKAWARNFMKKFKIPTPQFFVCKSQAEGLKFIKSQTNKSWFIKASGLAAGKGALYSKDNQEAIENVKKMSKFGKSGRTFLIEELAEGEEFSSFAIVNGSDFKIIGHAQDHKTVYNGDLGPNTGGMGCSSPPMAISKNIEKQIESIFKKVVDGLVQVKRPYLGILYLGGMIDKHGNVIVIEFNARWGDPEAQVIVPAIKNDFYELALSAIDGKLKSLKINLDAKYRIAVAATSRGYPSDYSAVIGKQIFGLDRLLRHPVSSLSHAEPFNRHSERSEESQDNLREGPIKVFGAGVKIKNGHYLVSGGRLFYVMAAGKNVAQARKIAYNALSQVYIEGNNLHYRTDIGHRDLDRFYRRR